MEASRLVPFFTGRVKMHALSFTCHVLNGSLQLELPITDGLDPLAQFLRYVRLGSVRLGRGALDELASLLAKPEIRKEGPRSFSGFEDLVFFSRKE